MRSTLGLLACAAVVAAAGCGGNIEVRTMAAPDARLERLHTFRMLDAPARRDGRAVVGSDDPMVSNSIANRAIREHIVKAFEDRGYVQSLRAAEFAVAFYATARDKLDVTVWDYGYPFDPTWRRYGPPRQTVTQYTEGSVIIDVIDASTRELLWRGEGTATLSDDAADNVKQLAKAAEAIVARFPKVTPRAIAER